MMFFTQKARSVLEKRFDSSQSREVSETFTLTKDLRASCDFSLSQEQRKERDHRRSQQFKLGRRVDK